jgi:YggT family protein
VFLDGLVSFIAWLLDAYFWVVVVAVIVSWVNPDPRNPLVRFLRQVTEPVFEPVRRWLPPWKTGGLDFSPMIVLIAIQFVERVILPSLFRLLY